MIAKFEIYKHSINEYQPENQFWKVRLDSPYFEISLDKIGATEDEKDEFLDRVNTSPQWRLHNYVFLGLDFNSETKYGTIGSVWYHNFDTKNFYFDGYKYMGEVEVTPEDIKKWKFKNDLNKYNL